MKIVVLAGGLSPERDVSLSSGTLIANALRRSNHEVILIDVYEGIQTEDKLEVLFNCNEQKTYIVPKEAPDLSIIKQKNNNGDSLIGPNVIKLCRIADMTFIALHGSMGENGQIQAMLDVLGIKYTGTGYIGSLLAMDKDISKKLINEQYILTPKWITIDVKEMDINHIIEKIGLPCVVKPCSNGSSIGISIVNNKQQLEDAIVLAKSHESKIIVEQKIEGREFSVGIIDKEPLPVIEIIPKQGFYDYKNKYQKGLTEEICPAEISETKTQTVQSLAMKIHDLLQLGSYSRIDFILNNEDEKFYCLEANTLPGMTPTSLLPQEALAKGISYTELCDRIVKLALHK